MVQAARDSSVFVHSHRSMSCFVRCNFKPIVADVRYFNMTEAPTGHSTTKATVEPEPHRLRTRHSKETGEPMTVAEEAKRDGQSVGPPQFFGTPSSITDQIEAFMGEVGGGGFMLPPVHNPGAIEDFVDLVVPELQRRGLFREDYTGTTQRDHLSQDD